MGCDVHAYLEYSDFVDQSGQDYWQCLMENAGRRDYAMFGLLAGVRSDDKPVVAPRGFPEGSHSWTVREAFYMRIVDEASDHERTATRAQAESWHVPVIKLHGSDQLYCGDPDMHTVSWITYEELMQVIGRYMTDCSKYGPYHVEWDAIAGAMRALEERGCKTRLVFGFDN